MTPSKVSPVVTKRPNARGDLTLPFRRAWAASGIGGIGAIVAYAPYDPYGPSGRGAVAEVANLACEKGPLLVQSSGSPRLRTFRVSDAERQIRTRHRQRILRSECRRAPVFDKVRKPRSS